jgi:hypothetical protein
MDNSQVWSEHRAAQHGEAAARHSIHLPLLRNLGREHIHPRLSLTSPTQRNKRRANFLGEDLALLPVLIKSQDTMPKVTVSNGTYSTVSCLKGTDINKRSVQRVLLGTAADGIFCVRDE